MAMRSSCPASSFSPSGEEDCPGPIVPSEPIPEFAPRQVDLLRFQAQLEGAVGLEGSPRPFRWLRNRPPKLGEGGPEALDFLRQPQLLGLQLAAGALVAVAEDEVLLRPVVGPTGPRQREVAHLAMGQNQKPVPPVNINQSNH